MRSATHDLPQFRLSAMVSHPVPRKVFSVIGSPIEKLLAFDRINAMYLDLVGGTDDRDFLTRSMELLGLRYDLPQEELERIPKEGSLVLVANHPFGVVEGMILADLVRKVRPDVKIMANQLLGLLPQTQNYLIGVDPFGTRGSKMTNRAPIRQALDWARSGHALGIFPAGEVAHLNLKKRAVLDPAWSPAVGKFIQRTEAAVVPVFFSGANGALFHLAGLVHPRMRTLLLPKEMINKGNRVIRVRVGSPIPPSELQETEDPTELMRLLRQRTYLLGLGNGNLPKRRRLKIALTPMEPIAAPLPQEHLATEVANLPAERVLIESGDFQVLFAPAKEMPLALLEIGRLREETFRAVGEGTGKSVDLDKFDESYWHLVLWHRTNQEVVGAYRVCRTDEQLIRYGLDGFYTRTLFDYDEEMIRKLGPALELGRSFVRVEYQRAYAPLMLLWKGIAQILIREPRYKVFLGPVSISSQYPPAAQRLIVDFLERNHGAAGLSDRVLPRNPARLAKSRAVDLNDLAARSSDLDDVSRLIADMDSALGGVPILVRQYVKLGGRLLGANVDPDFSNVLDVLLTVDLERTEPKVMERFMGKVEAQRFMAIHGIGNASPLRRTPAA
jgi:putative hemolysin